MFFSEISQNLQENTCAGLRPATLLKRDSNAGVSRDLCEIFKNTFYKEHFQETASQTYFENVWSSGSEVLYKKEFLKI